MNTSMCNQPQSRPHQMHTTVWVHAARAVESVCTLQPHQERHSRLHSSSPINAGKRQELLEAYRRWRGRRR